MVNPNRKTLIVPIVALATSLVCAGAASAQGRGRDRERGSGDRQQSAPSQPQGGAVPRAREQAPREQAPPPQRPQQSQSQAPRQQQTPPVQTAPRFQSGPRNQDTPRFQGGSRAQDAPRSQGGPRVQDVPRVQSGPRVQGVPQRQGSYNAAPYRQEAPSRVAPQSRSYQGGGAVPRSYAYSNQRGYSSNGYSSGRFSRSYGYSRESYWPRLRSSFYAPRFFYTGSSFRSYFDFRPRFRLGLGLYIGYPLAYPTWYDPYISTSYSWYRPGMSYGGVSFDIQPEDAEVFVDGDYVGVVEDFGPDGAPLTLPPGTHHIDLQADGFGPLSFDITVVPRQVIPYQGTLPRY